MLHDVLPTGSVALDVALGIGGWARGHVVEVFGPETVGKSTLGLCAVRAAQRAGEEAAFIDLDHTFDLEYARAVGVAVNRLVVSQPANGEQAFGIARTLLRSGAVAAVVIDSIASVVPAAELSGRLGAVDPGVRLRLIDRSCRDLFELAAERNALVLVTNRPMQKQTRTGWVETGAAGNVLPEVASVRVCLSRLDGDETMTRVRASVAKNALGSTSTPRQTDFVIRWGAGIDRSSDLLVAAFDLGVIGAAGARFFFDGASLGDLEETRAALLGPLGERVQAAIVAAAPWRAPAPLPAGKAASA